MSLFNKRSLLEKIADAALSFGAGAAKEFGIEMALEAYTDATKKFIDKIERNDVGNAFLRRFRGRFVRVVKITIKAIDEIDGQLHGKNPHRWNIIEDMLDEDYRPPRRIAARRKEHDDE